MKNRTWLLILLIVVLSFIGLIWFFGLVGFLIGLPWALILAILSNLDLVADAIASSYKVLRRVNFAFERKAVERRLEVTIGNSAKKLNEEAGVDLLPHGIDIRWVEPEERQVFLEKNVIVTCLESSYNEEENLARATMLYVEEDLIYESQRFINTTIMKSLSFAVARKLLMLDRKLSALKCLNEEFLEPEIAKIPQIRDYVSGMDKLDKQGLLTRLLLKEFSKLHAKLSPALTDTQSRKETKSFVKFLKNFVEKTGEPPLPFLDYQGAVFRIGLLPVAKLQSFHIDNFLKAATHHYDEDVNTVYVLAMGKNVALGKLVASEIEKKNLYLKNAEWEYKAWGSRKRKLIKHYVAELLKV